MKYNLLIFSLYLSLGNLQSQEVKNVVVEHFTNTRCSICASRNPGFYTNLGNHPNILHISFHPSSPYSNCFLNNHNPTENDDRTKYYNLYGSTPQFIIQGEKIPSSVNVSQAALFTPFTGQTTSAKITINQQKFGNDSMQCTVVVKTAAAHGLGNLKLFVALVEDTIAYNAPNGEQLHHDVFRKALTDIEGDLMNLPANIGDSLVFKYSAPNNSDWNFKRIYTMAILQEESNQKVVQVEATPSDPAGSPIGMLEISGNTSNLIYPNPSRSVINVESKQEMTQIEFYDSKGKLVFKPLLEQKVEKFKLEVKDFPRGVYFIHIRSNNKTVVEKVILY